MRKSLLAASTLALGFMALATPAQAGCNDVTCNINSSYSHGSSYTSHYGSSYGSGYGSHSMSYGSGSASMSAPCPAGSSRGADGLCMSHSSGSSYSSSSSYSSYGSSTGGSGYTSYSSMASMPAESPRIVPFTGSVSSFSSARLAGLGANESLAPTECPVSVYNPEGGKVLGCYSVVKPKPVVKTKVHYNTVRVVRPIIYVRYPVPVAVPVARPACNVVTDYSRYGGHWPRGGWGHSWGQGGCGW